MSNEFTTIKEMLEDIDMKINHIEDTMVDFREVMVKLVKQNNQIVLFLKELETEITEEYEAENLPPFPEFGKTKSNDDVNIKRVREVQDIIDGLIEKNKELKEFEDELQKHKDELTPGQHGES